ncbi:MAG: glycosyl hydrolase family 28-related protein, partial [Dehalococcoidales bacterium]|nr:glycosyl hydrolase family 28-related protein [Dehalococcoidales bacterium]
MGEPFVQAYNLAVKSYKFLTLPWREVIPKELGEGVIVKRVEVSQVVEPIKEITRETIQQVTKIDDTSLAEVRAHMSYLEEEIGKRLYAPGGVVSQTIYVSEPVSSPKIYQENGEIVLQTLGSGNVILTAATGLQMYGQQVVIESTNVLNPLIYLASKTRIDGDTTITGSLNVGSNLSVGEETTLTGNLTITGDMTVTGAQNYSGVVEISASSTSPSLTITQSGSGETLKLVRDNSNYMTATVTTTGAVILDAQGTAASFVFRDAIFQPTYGSDDGLVLYLPFSEGMTSSTANKTYDKSPYGNDGIFVNFPMPTNVATSGSGWATTTCKVGSCLTLDGGNDYVSVAYNPLFDITEAITVEAWIYPTDTGNTTQDIIGRNYGDAKIPYLFRYYTSDYTSNKLKLSFRSYTGAVEYGAYPTNLLLTPNQWQHVAVTFSEGTVYFYINGVSDDAQSYTNGAFIGSQFGISSLPLNTTNLNIGMYNSSNYYNGGIDEVRVYNRALTADEIRTHYLRGSNTNGTILADKFRVVNSTNTVAFQIDGAGNSYFNTLNLGIGTTTPRYKFDVWGDLAVGTTTDNIPVLYVDSGEGGMIGIGTTGASEKLTVYGGDIGVTTDGTATTTISSATSSFASYVTGIFPIQPTHLATKEYVDTRGSSNISYYISDTASGVSSNYFMYTDETAEAQSTFTSTTVDTGNNQILFRFITEAGQPNFSELSPGSYLFHFHASTNGTKPYTIYWRLFASSTDETLTALLTSESSIVLTSEETSFNISAATSTSYEFAAGDRLVLVLYTDAAAAGVAGDIVVYAEGTEDSRLDVVTPSASLLALVVKRDGTSTLTNNWYTGGYGIVTGASSTFVGDLTAGNSTLFIDDAGYVGIATTTPSYALDVWGTARTEDFITKGPWIDVRAFGATGDGVTDDTAAIAAALDSLGTDGGTVYFPEGIYLVTELNVSKSSVILKGMGRGTSGGSTTEIRATTGAIASMPYITGNYVTVRDMQFNGNGISEQFNLAGSYCNVDNIYSSGYTHYNFYGGGGNLHTISNSNFYSGAARTSVNVTQFLNNYFNGNGTYASLILEGGANMVIRGNTFESYSTAIYLATTSGNTIVSADISNNYFESAYDDGHAVIDMGNGSTGLYSINVTNNYFGPTDADYYIRTTGTVASLNIQGNNFHYTPVVEAIKIGGKVEKLVSFNNRQGIGDGVMGIATSTPRYTLDVWGDLAIGTSTDTDTPILYVDSGNGGRVGIGTTTLSGLLTVGTTTPALVVAPNGYVGIGVATPDQFVDIRKDQNLSTVLHLENLTSGTLAKAILLLEASGLTGQMGVNNASFVTNGNLVADQMFIQSASTASGGLLIESLAGNISIMPTSNVGIGTTGPSELLTIFSSTDPTLQIGSGSATTTIVGNGTSTFPGGLIVDTSSLYVMADTGYVGIGDTTPDTKLDVQGMANVGGLLTSMINTRTNLLTNGSMESTFSAGGIAAGWAQYGAGSPTFSEETTNIHSGAKAQKIMPGTYGLLYQRVNLTAGNYYTVSAWVDPTNTSYLKLKNAADTVTYWTVYTTGTGWQRLTHTFQASATELAWLHIGSEAVGSIDYFDDISFSQYSSSTVSTGASSFVVTVDGNVGLATSSPSARFTVNSSVTNSFIVTSAGTVGVGTVSPRYKLDVLGDLAVGTSTDASTPVLYIDSGNGGRVGIGTTTLSGLLTVGTTTPALVVDPRGYVGIGTTTPTSLFSVAGDAYITGTLTVGGASSGNIQMQDDKWIGLGAAAGRLVFDDQTPDYLTIQDAIFGIGTTTPRYTLDVWGDFVVGTTTSYGGQNMPLLYVDSGNGAGKIGIATSTPRYALDVWGSLAVGTSTSPVFFVDTGIPSITVGADMSIGSLQVASSSGAITFVDTVVEASAALGTEESYSFQIDSQELFRIYAESDGTGGIQKRRVFTPITTNFGIGTTTPRYTLDVYGTLAVGTSSASYTGASSTPALYVLSGNGGQVGIGTTTLAGLLTAGTSTPALVVAPNGYVGIGTTTPLS